MNSNKLLVLITAILAFTSCEKEISLKLPASAAKLVIEGAVTDTPGPYSVKLSKTVTFNNSNTFPTVSGALVILSDNQGQTDTLNEQALGLYQTNSLQGIPGNTYTLEIYLNGEYYKAVSTMPQKIPFDSIQFDVFDDPDETGITYSVVPLFYDPLEFGNCYRFLLSSNGIQDKTYQVTNDNIGNGLLNQQPFFSDNLKFYEGDTVQVSMLCIDTPTYNYFYTLSQVGESGPGGGAAPTNPPSNIQGKDVLGIFSAYTLETKVSVIN